MSLPPIRRRLWLCLLLPVVAIVVLLVMMPGGGGGGGSSSLEGQYMYTSEPDSSPAASHPTTAGVRVGKAPQTLSADPTSRQSSTANTQNRNKKGRHSDVLCVLPVGDSLTQGVGVHPSYRELLAEPLRRWWAEAAGSGTQQRPTQQHDESHLHKTLDDSMGDSGSSSSNHKVVFFSGSQAHRCTPKRPWVPYIVDPLVRSSSPPRVVADRHEGHCSWTASAVAAAVEQFLQMNLTKNLTTSANTKNTPISPSTPLANPQPKDEEDDSALLERGCWGPVADSRSTSSTSTISNKVSAVRYRRVVLLLVGHNDVFRAAKACRLREHTTFPYGHYHDHHKQYRDNNQSSSASSSSSSLSWWRIDEDRACGGAAPNTANSAAAAACVRSLFMGKGGLFESWTRIVNAINNSSSDHRDSSTSSTQSAADGSSTTTTSRTHVLIGVNPPTAFPCADAVLRQLVDAFILKASASPTTSMSTLAAVPFLPGTVTKRDTMKHEMDPPAKEDEASSLASAAAVPDKREGEGEAWRIGYHTFDTVHPNANGAAVMARAWMAAIRTHVPM